MKQIFILCANRDNTLAEAYRVLAVYLKGHRFFMIPVESLGTNGLMINVPSRLLGGQNLNSWQQAKTRSTTRPSKRRDIL